MKNKLNFNSLYYNEIYIIMKKYVGITLVDCINFLDLLFFYILK